MATFRPGGFFNSIPPVVKNLIIINVIMALAQHVLYSSFHGFDLQQYLALFNPKDTADFRPWQFVTHMFMHGDPRSVFATLVHLGLNMYGLWMFGRILEGLWGSTRFLIFYFICGLGAAAIYTAVQYLPIGAPVIGERVVGASGAIYGLLAAFGVLMPDTKLYIIPIPIAIRTKWLVLCLGLYELIMGLKELLHPSIASNDPSDLSVAHFAHLGGMLTAVITLIIWKRLRTDSYRRYS